MRQLFLASLFQVLLLVLSHGQSFPPAEIVFVNGNIYTGCPANGISISGVVVAKCEARAEAMAVRAGRLTAVGTNSEIRKWNSRKTRLVDLRNHFVMPGFNDAHLHLETAGLQKLRVDLVGANSLQEMKTRLAEYSKRSPRESWIQGMGWDHTLWAGGVLPKCTDLDEATEGHPAFLLRIDGHIGVANSIALSLAGITRDTPDPAGGHIDRNENGEPTGILRESAMQRVKSKIPAPTGTELRRALELELADAAKWGITSAQDYSDWPTFLTYEQLGRENKLTLRISEWLPLNTPVKELEQRRAHHRGADPWLRVVMLKGFMDGSLGSRTAALLAPYSDDSGNSGLPQYEESKLEEISVERAAAGFQLGFHAIGDRGMKMALDTFAAVKSALPNRNDFRFRVEHAQVIAPDQFAKLRELKVIASVQPAFLLYDMTWGVARLGPERAAHSYPWGELAANGIPLAFGTDAPVEVLNPFRGLYAAVTRKNEAGTSEYFPEQRLSIDQAVAAYTAGAAYAEFSENDKGRLAPGMLADFVVLDRDITHVSPSEMLRSRVLYTVVGGKTIYSAHDPTLP